MYTKRLKSVAELGMMKLVDYSYITRDSKTLKDFLVITNVREFSIAIINDPGYTNHRTLKLANKLVVKTKYLKKIVRNTIVSQNNAKKAFSSIQQKYDIKETNKKIVNMMKKIEMVRNMVMHSTK